MTWNRIFGARSTKTLPHEFVPLIHIEVGTHACMPLLLYTNYGQFSFKTFFLRILLWRLGCDNTHLCTYTVYTTDRFLLMYFYYVFVYLGGRDHWTKFNTYSNNMSVSLDCTRLNSFVFVVRIESKSVSGNSVLDSSESSSWMKDSIYMPATNKTGRWWPSNTLADWLLAFATCKSTLKLLGTSKVTSITA